MVHGSHGKNKCFISEICFTVEWTQFSFIFYIAQLIRVYFKCFYQKCIWQVAVNYFNLIIPHFIHKLWYHFVLHNIYKPWYVIVQLKIELKKKRKKMNSVRNKNYQNYPHILPITMWSWSTHSAFLILVFISRE